MIDATLLYVLIGLFLILLTALLVRSARTHKSGGLQNAYVSGLTSLIDGEYQQALDKLRNVVRRDTENVDAYILIGDILRQMDASESAIKVHRDLLVRPNLSSTQRRKILVSLAKDYEKNEQYRWALSTCDTLLDLNKKDAWTWKFKLKLYEHIGDWQGAFDTLRKHVDMPKAEKAVRLGLYKVEQGLQLAAMQREHDARLAYREALKQNSTCTPAFIELFESYIREKREKDALKELKKFVQSEPECACVALEELKNILFDIGAYGDLEKYYLQIIQNRPALKAPYISLAEIYEKKGELNQAITYCNKVLEKEENFLPAKLLKIRLNYKLQRLDQVGQLASELATAYLERNHRYVCRDCNAERDVYFWHCESCGAWNTAKRRN